MVLTALWVSPVGQPGGVGRHLTDVARVGIPGWRLVFLVPPGVVADELRATGAAVVTGPIGPDFGLRDSVSTLRRVVKRLRPQVVHTHLSYADIVSPIATGGLAVKLVSTEHGIAADDLVYHGSRARSRVMAAVHTARLRRFDAAIAVADATRDAMRAKWHRRDIVVVPNGIDAPERPTRRPGLRIASIARLSPEKRIDALIDAFALVRTMQPDATLTIAGDGPLDGTLRSRAAGVPGVRFVGHVPADEVLANHDIVVQLSVWENCSYTLLDAMAAGLGVVATPVGGNPELLPPDCLVPADDPDAVAAAILRQGLDTASRPSVPEWPGVADMTAGIARVYASIGAQP